MNITMPDFEVWASNLENSGYFTNTMVVSEALKQAFEQGQALGYLDGKRDGYRLGCEGMPDYEQGVDDGRKQVLDLLYNQYNAVAKAEITNPQEWWEPQDSDKEWLASHDEPTEE